MAIVIDSARYGDSAAFESLDQAQDAIRACGGDFAETALEIVGDEVRDETGERIGRIIELARSVR